MWILLGMLAIAALAAASSKKTPAGGGGQMPPGAIASLSDADRVALFKFLAPTHLVLDLPQPTGYESTTAVMTPAGSSGVEASDFAVYRENMAGAYVFTNHRAADTDPVKIVAVMPGTPGQLPAATIAAMGYVLFLPPKDASRIWALAYPGQPQPSVATPALPADVAAAPGTVSAYGPGISRQIAQAAMPATPADAATRTVDQIPEPMRTQALMLLANGNSTDCQLMCDALINAGYTTAAQPLCDRARSVALPKETWPVDQLPDPPRSSFLTLFKTGTDADLRATGDSLASLGYTTAAKQFYDRATQLGLARSIGKLAPTLNPASTADPKTLDVHDLPADMPLVGGATAQLHDPAVAAFEGADGAEALKWARILSVRGYTLASSQLLARARQLGNFDPV